MQLIDRVSVILLAVAGYEGGPLSISELSRQARLPKAATHRIAESLTLAGMLFRDEDKRYRLGALTMELGMLAVARQDVRVAALPALHDLRDETGETATLSLRIGFERVYLLQVESQQGVRRKVELDHRYPLYAGASGRAILAALSPEDMERYFREVVIAAVTPHTVVDHEELRAKLEEVRRLGYAASRGERDACAAAVAAPVRGLGGHVVGAISVAAPIMRLSRNKALEYGPLVRARATQLSREIGSRDPRDATVRRLTQATGRRAS